jgi:hypothetical protein
MVVYGFYSPMLSLIDRKRMTGSCTVSYVREGVRREYGRGYCLITDGELLLHSPSSILATIIGGTIIGGTGVRCKQS